MPGPRPMANTAQLLVKGDVNGKHVLNTFYFHYTPGLPLPEIALSQLVDDWVTVVSGSFVQCLQQDYKLVELVATDLGALPQTSFARLIQPPITGTRPGAVSPGNVSLGVRRVSAYRGRSYRGRIELPAIEKADVLRDVITSALQAAVTNLAIQALRQLGTANGAPFVPAIGSYKLVGSYPIVAWLFDLVIDSQKTRLLGHGD